MKDQYEIRIKESGGQKKSKFYQANSTKQAAGHYTGPHEILWVKKVPREKVLGIGSFFHLGDELLKDMQSEELVEHRKEEERIRNRRHHLQLDKRNI